MRWLWAILWLSVAAEAESDGDAGTPKPTRHAAECRLARIDWGILNEAMPVYVTTSGDYRPAWHGDTYQGERRYVADAERPAHVREVEARLSTYCADPNDGNAAREAYQAWVQAEYCKVARVKLDVARQERSRTPRGEIERLDEQVRRTCG